MTSGLLPAKWIGIMPDLQEKAYHKAVVAPEVDEHFVDCACAPLLQMPIQSVKMNAIIYRKELCIYSLLTIE